ncbi:hypothetical protein ACQPZP_34725 [Spirillospora sp. CA-142024]|uniref:hypothetical protein n=1 Tax=Spirillospora sp. CA-142024 TaxID=3240036 RepID=UPI003D8C4862
MAHVKAVCAATSLGLIVYHRANAAYTATTVAALLDACPNLVGFKTGSSSCGRTTIELCNLVDVLKTKGLVIEDRDESSLT